MTITISTILLLVALILFVIAALGVSASRFNIMAAGLAFLCAALLFG